MVFLEREAQLQSLDVALRQARDGHGCTALVYGEAGIGKTSLVENFLQAQANSWRILRGTCDSLFTPRPLGPLHDIALLTGGTLLKRLESRSDRSAIFSACLSELHSQPSIVVVEDIHWADEATLDLLKYLGRRVGQTSTLMILTYRDDEIGAEHPLRQLLGDLGPTSALHRIPVSPLSRAAVQELARDTKVDPVELHRLTNGNPFYVTEVLATDGGIPETVRDAVLARAAHLSPAARRTLEAAAVIGLRVEPWLLSRVAGADSDQIEECFAVGMLQSQGDYYAFRHELARQTILACISPSRKVILHRVALEALQDAPESQKDLARLANHAEGTQEASRVLEYAPRAARQAARAGAHRQAALLYELALRFAAELSTEQHAQMLEAYADERWFQGLATLVPVRQEIIEKHRALGNGLREGVNLALLASELHAAGRDDESEAAIGAAIAILGALPPGVELALAYRAQGYLRLEKGRFLESVAAGEKSIALSEHFGDMDILARASYFVGYALLLMEDVWGSALMQRSLAIGREHGLHWAVGLTLSGWTDALVRTFHFGEAEPLLQEGIAYTTEHDDDGHLEHLFSNQASMNLHQGLWTAAAEVVAHTLRRPGYRALWFLEDSLTLTRVAVRRGDAGVQAALDEALAQGAQTYRFEYVCAARSARAEASWLRGDHKQALAEVRALYDEAVSQHVPWIAGELAFWRWRAGDEFTPPAWVAAPFAAQMAGDWQRAAFEWEQRGCPYERAMALMDGDETAQLQALRIFEHLGAGPIAEKLKQQMRARGVRGIPRGPRPATRGNAFGLTARELDVLSALVSGSSNKAIAKRLSLSVRTVEHHLTSILQKTGTQSRSEAVALALHEKLVDGR